MCSNPALLEAPSVQQDHPANTWSIPPLPTPTYGVQLLYPGPQSSAGVLPQLAPCTCYHDSICSGKLPRSSPSLLFLQLDRNTRP